MITKITNILERILEGFGYVPIDKCKNDSLTPPQNPEPTHGVSFGDLYSQALEMSNESFPPMLEDLMRQAMNLGQNLTPLSDFTIRDEEYNVEVATRAVQVSEKENGRLELRYGDIQPDTTEFSIWDSAGPYTWCDTMNPNTMIVFQGTNNHNVAFYVPRIHGDELERLTRENLDKIVDSYLIGVVRNQIEGRPRHVGETMRQYGLERNTTLIRILSESMTKEIASGIAGAYENPES